MIKTLKLFTLLLLALYFYLSCERPTNTEDEITKDRKLAEKFEIHLQHHFNDTHIYFEIDEKRVFDGTVTTNYITSLAAIIAPEILAGSHHLRVLIDVTEADTTFTVQDTLIIGVTYDSSAAKIKYKFYKPPNLPQYD